MHTWYSCHQQINSKRNVSRNLCHWQIVRISGGSELTLRELHTVLYDYSRQSFQLGLFAYDQINQDNMRGQRATLPVHTLWYAIASKVIYRFALKRKYFFWDVRIKANLDLMWLVGKSVCARLAQLVKSLTANWEVPGSIPGLVERWTLGDLLSPHRPWTGTLSRWSSLSTFYRGT